ncbi:MAG: glycosyltransferase family 2 protein [Roseburia sp.]|nr:glycosyltransferase family 2 protein [Roseburia sp.]MCM1098619.1 glycosyltransferase family 2 protein [Ruminococcus flavefaciens]
MKKITFVIPCYRSERTLPHVVEEIREKMKDMGQYGYDILLVNDCSPDGTAETIRRLCLEYENVKGVSFAKNFGQHAALMAGLRHSDGDYVVCLDDDGQTPADEADKLIAKLEEGYDAVYAKYEHKQHSLFRNLGSKVNEYMTRIMLGKPAELYLSSYFAVKRFVVEDMIRYENSYPYVIGLVLRATSHIANVTVSHREREEGTSGYTLKKLLGLWFNGFTAFSVKPLRIATGLGGFSALVGFLYGIYTVIKRILNPDVPVGFSSTMAAIVFFGGMIMVLLGMIGEYIGRIYISLNNSPQYVIRETMNIGSRPDEEREEQRKRAESRKEKRPPEE